VNVRDTRRRVRAWGRRQLYSFFSSLGTLLGHRLGTLMTVLVLGIAMLLPLGLYVTVGNLRAVDLQHEDWGTISVFLQPDIDGEAAQTLATRIGHERGAGVTTVSPEQGMEEFRDASGFGQALELFEESPLPWVLHVIPEIRDGEDIKQRVDELSAWLGEQDGVDFVQADFKWLQRLAGLLALGDAFVSVLTALFALAAVVVVANTIRLDVASRAEEIQVLHLVGASNGFVRQPFLYLGFWYGLLGALLALLLLGLSTYYLAQPLERLLDAYGNAFAVSGLGGRATLTVLLAGGLLGLLGAGVSVQRFLRQFRLEEVDRPK
jgi:cell division transport system permease protein